MTPLQVLLLGIVQGLTEFFPVSSSGHLVLVESFFALQISPRDLLGLNVLLHSATLIALLLVYLRTWINILLSPFRRDTERMRLLILLVIATVPAGVIGILFEEVFAERFNSPQTVGMHFLLTAIILILGESVSWKRSMFSRLFRSHIVLKGLTVGRALFIGFAQALALPAGLSRSGLTFSAGRFMGMSRDDAVQFSFLMLVPVLAGATLLMGIDVARGEVLLPALPLTLIGFFSSFVASFFAIIVLRRFAARWSFNWFALYLVTVGIFLMLS